MDKQKLQRMSSVALEAVAVVAAVEALAAIEAVVALAAVEAPAISPQVEV